MRSSNVHLTLAFLGSTDPARVAAAERAAAGVSVERFLLRLDTPGYWSHNAIAWAGIGSVPDALQTTAARLRAALVDAEVPFDAKPFVPHVTLVRKARPGFALPPLEPIEWPVHGFALVRSVPAEGGSDYVVCRRWP